MFSTARHNRALSCLFILFFCSLWAGGLTAADPPHDATEGVGCFSCHDVSSTNPMLLPDHPRAVPDDIDDTLRNNNCWGCHVDANPPVYVETHSSIQSNSGKYGAWTVECPVCHNQHDQEQNDLYTTTFGKFIRTNVNLGRILLYDGGGNPLTDPDKSGFRPVTLTAHEGLNSYADGVGAVDGICEVCHTRTGSWRNDGSVAGAALHTGLEGSNCTTKCHDHTAGFIHGNGERNCNSCHHIGDSAGTHIRYPGLAGPSVTCEVCHDLTDMPNFADGSAVTNLAGTTVCDTCHSPDGAFDGVDDPTVGAKANWATGVYTGSALAAGKEQWCVTCHDLGTSVIKGRQAPDVAGDNTDYGYYVSGHGMAGATQECGACHGLAMDHNFDGQQTYAGVNDNYKEGYRLMDVDGAAPLDIPLTGGFSLNAFKLCLDCHDAETLLSDTKDHGCYDSTANPYRNAAAITTQFRNMHQEGHDTSASGYDTPANFHADHLIDVNGFGGQWFSDGPGTLSGGSGVSCVTCHNPHGDKRNDGSATLKMTIGFFEVVHGSDAYGEYGEVTSNAAYLDGSPQRVCNLVCHAFGGNTSAKWYYNPVPTLTSIALADNNGSDPVAAETGFTNSLSISVISDSDFITPDEIQCAEDDLFTVNVSAWAAYTSPYTYTLLAGEGSRTVYCKTRNGYGESLVRSAAITVDTIDPAILATTLTSPDGSEVWAQGTNHAITWTSTDITDANLKASPISLAYSTDSGSTFPNGIAAGEANDGTYPWNPTPLIHATTVQVQVTATDRAGNQASDASNGDFTIQAVTATIDSFTVSDSNNSDPAPAETGFTNNAQVDIAISASNYPTEMQLAQDAGFTQNPTGWIAYSAAATYTLAGGDGAKTVWLQLRNDAGVSGTSSYAITLDTTAPVFTGGSSALTSPNGAEVWQEGETTRAITWNSGITETNLKASPITLEYSTDAGNSYPYVIAADEANDGTFAWNPIPKPASYATIVRLTATDRAGNQGSDVSDAVFLIQPPAQYIVTNTNNTGAGSLRQAMTDLIAAGGNDSIWFNIGSGLTNNVAVINLTSILPTITAPGIIIDGGSQAALSGFTNSNGPEVRIHGTYGFNGFNISANNVTIRELQITNFYFYGINVAAAGTNAHIEKNHIGFWSDNVTGYTTQGNYAGIYVAAADCTIGGSLSARNYLSGNVNEALYLNTSSRIIIDNNFIGLRPDGAAMSNGVADYAVYAVYPHDGIIQNNMFSGSSSALYVAYPTALTIRGNIFGLYYDGANWHQRTAPRYGVIRINSTSARNVMIGGPNVATDDNTLNDSNVFSASSAGTLTEGSAIYVFQHNGGMPTKIYGNFIGTNPEQDEVFTGRTGVYLGASSSYTTVGGTGAGEAGNVIANMSANGVYLESGSIRVKISGNSFYDNGTSLDGSDDAIQLNGTANNSITRPTISAADTASVTVDGIAANNVVEVYLSDYDGSGTEYGEGITLIGTATAAATSVAVDVSGAGINVNDWVTAIRRDTNNNTSAFSLNFQVQ